MLNQGSSQVVSTGFGYFLFYVIDKFCCNVTITCICVFLLPSKVIYYICAIFENIKHNVTCKYNLHLYLYACRLQYRNCTKWKDTLNHNLVILTLCAMW